MPFSSTSFFQFESDFIASLRCIPMVVRFKLDTCGIKLKLDQWHRLREGDRQQLVQQPCETPSEIDTYRTYLSNLIWQYTQTPAVELPLTEHPPWLNSAHIPDSVQEKAQAIGILFDLQQWQALEPLQRFALMKLSRSSHENRNFLPALQEFGCQASLSAHPRVVP